MVHQMSPLIFSRWTSMTHFVRLLGSQARCRNPSNSIIIAKKSARSFKTGLIFTFWQQFYVWYNYPIRLNFETLIHWTIRLNTTLNNIWIAIPSNFKASLLWMLSFLCCAPIYCGFSRCRFFICLILFLVKTKPNQGNEFLTMNDMILVYGNTRNNKCYLT